MHSHRKGPHTRDLDWSQSSKVIKLALARLTRSMPEEKPLNQLRLFLGIGEAEVMVLIHRIKEIQ